MAEDFASVIKWGDDTFGPCTADRALSRAMEEKQELDDELAKPVRDAAAIAIEAADVIICMLRVPGILAAIETKMAINRKRTWNVGTDGTDGTGYHVKAGDQP